MGLKRYGGPPSAVAKADHPCVDLPDVCTGCSGCAVPSAEGIAPKADFTMARLTTNPQRVQGTPQPVAAPASAASVLEEAVMAEVLKALAKT